MQRIAPLLLALSTGPLALTTDLTAAERQFVGPRAGGMGGVGVASSDDIHAQYYNPAAFGFMASRQDDALELPDAPPPPEDAVDNAAMADRVFGLGVDAQFGIGIYGDVGRYLENLSDIDNVELATTDGLSAEDAETVLAAFANLTALQRDQIGFQFDANLGANVRVGHLAVGARYFADGYGVISEVDLTNLGLDDAAELTNALDSNAGTIIGSSPASYTIQTLDASQQATLSAAGYSNDAIKAIDKVATDQQGSGLINDTELQELVDAIALVTSAADGSLEDNGSRVTLVGLGVVEIPVSYGYAFNPNLAIGVTAKLMLGRVYGQDVLVFSEDNDDFTETLDEDYEDTVTFGVDVAAMYRLPNFQFGLIGRNINKPSFDGFEKDGRRIPDVEIDPSVTAGAAWMPIPSLVVEVNGDLFARDNLFPDREIQYLGGGLEWEVLRFLSLRGGAYDNLAESDEDPVLTAGVGFNFWLLRIDLNGAYGTGTVEYDGEDYPNEARVGLGIRSVW